MDNERQRRRKRLTEALKILPKKLAQCDRMLALVQARDWEALEAAFKQQRADIERHGDETRRALEALLDQGKRIVEVQRKHQEEARRHDEPLDKNRG